MEGLIGAGTVVQIDVLETLRSRVAYFEGVRDSVKERLDNVAEELERVSQELQDTQQARTIFNQVVEATQQAFASRVSALVTTAIRSVFDRDFEFVFEFVRRKNKVEVAMKVREGDREYDPTEEMGGSIVDVVSFALRVVFWVMMGGKRRATLVLDEPMKFVGKGEQLDRAGRMMREVSERLGLQLIVVTHEPQLMDIADRVYSVRWINGRSVVVEEGKGEVLPEPKRVLRRRRK